MKPSLSLLSMLMILAITIWPALPGVYAFPAATDLVEASTLQQDQRIDLAIDALRRTGDWRAQAADLADRFRTTGGEIAFAPIEPFGRTTGDARFDPETNQSRGMILINSIFAPLPAQLAAAVLAHELIHLFELSVFFPDVAVPPGSDFCWVTEYHAFYAGAFAWRELRRRPLDTSGLTPEQVLTTASLVASFDEELRLVNQLYSPDLAEHLEARIKIQIRIEAIYRGRCTGDPPPFIPPPPSQAPPAQPQPTVVDAKIEIVFPHDEVGNRRPVNEAILANVGVFLFFPGSLTPVPCDFDEPVRLFRALNSNVAEDVGFGTPRLVQAGGRQITLWEWNDIDVSQATNPLNKYYFFILVDHVRSNTNVWAHGSDARTILPVQDVPDIRTPGHGQTLDAKIEIVFPHDRQGNPRSVVEADLVNVGADIFAHRTLTSVPPETNLIVRLFRSLNNGVEQFVGVGQKQLLPRQVGGTTVVLPRWVFNDVDVSAARNPLNKYYFRVAIDGINTFSNIWSHGADARTIFPIQDAPTSSCQ